MKIFIPALLGKIPLADYAPELGDQVLTVWLNPPTGLLAEYDQCFARVRARNEEVGQLDPDDPDRVQKAGEIFGANKPDVDRMLGIISELLSAGPEGTRISPEELNAMIEGLADTDPGFYFWVVGRVFRAIGEHRNAKKKP